MFAVMFFLIGVQSAFSQDLIILKDGNVIEAKVTEISPHEIRYRRIHHLDGPVIVISRTDVLSIRYENGTVETFNTTAAVGQEHGNLQQETISTEKLSTEGSSAQIATTEGASTLQSGIPTLIQLAVNQLPAIPIAGKNIKFELDTDTWIAKVNGNNFLSGDCLFQESDTGYILTLRTTNVWSGAVEEVIDLLQMVGVPLGPAAGPLRTAARLAASVAKWIPLKGSAIILEYIEGPPVNISFLRMEKQEEEKQTRERREREASNVKKNWLSVIAPVGIGLKYERMLGGSPFSLGADLFYQITGVFFENIFGFNTNIYCYPFGRAFYFGSGFGYSNYVYYDYDNRTEEFIRDAGFTISPGFGWRIDFKNTKGLFMDLGLSIPIIITEKNFGFNFYLKPHLGMGLSW